MKPDLSPFSQDVGVIYVETKVPHGISIFAEQDLDGMKISFCPCRSSMLWAHKVNAFGTHGLQPLAVIHSPTNLTD